MQPEMYTNLMAAAIGDKEALKTIKKSIAERNTDSLVVTIKDYNLKHGLSNLIHSDINNKQEVFHVSGVMGKGLNIQK